MARRILTLLTPNPESRKERDVEKAYNEQIDEGKRSTGTTDGSSRSEPPRNDSHLDLDDEQDDNDIIRNYELEDNGELVDIHTGRPLSTSYTWTSTYSGPRQRQKMPEWWYRFKAFLYPPDSDADQESFVPNYRYTPIISGILIPFSILLEIPGLTEHWYIRTVNNAIVENRPNTFILDFGLGTSMAFAVLANLALVMRFLEKNVKVMTILCVVFLTIHDLINIAAVTIFGVEHRFDDGFTYGQSFWMTVCSTAVSSVTNATLIWDLIRTPDFASSGSGLTRKQRSLIIMVIILLVYIAFGALIHSEMIHLDFIDALYFTICAIETIGFGDIVPHTAGSKVFTCFYAIFGIMNLALAVSLTRETVLEAMEVGYRKRVHTVRQRRRYQRWARRVSNRWREAVGWRLREAGQPIWKHDELDGWVHFEWFIRLGQKILPWTQSKRLGAVAHPRGMHLNLEALTGTQLEAAAMEAGVPLNDLLPPGFAKRWKVKQRVAGGTKSGECDRERERDPGSHFGLSWLGRLQDAQKSLDPQDIPLTHARLGRMVAMLGSFALAVDKSGWLNGDIPWKVDNPPNSAGSGGSSGSGEGQDRGGPADAPKLKTSLSQQYDTYRQGLESEETKAFYARLLVVWMLFLLFWMLGSGVFMATEDWTFGNALYFCVIAFTTLGLGDFTPKSPAGRSFFVAWALLGVATMTILISVLSEAYSSRYKTAVQSTKVFDKAVNRYKAKQKALASRPKKKKSVLQLPSQSLGLTSSSSPRLGASSPSAAISEGEGQAYKPQPSTAEEHEIIIQETENRVKRQLEDLPGKILRHAKTFHEHLQYFVGPGSVGGASGPGGPEEGKEMVPESLKKLLDDIAGAMKFGERIQNEILQDADARHTLFTLSIEEALRKMIEAAEDAIESLEERDLVLASREDRLNKEQEQGQQQGQGGTAGDANT